jgi:predicted nuclease of predicted toxin-antitoxin system
VKLLFDQNLSPRLVEELSPLFPGCKHVREFGLERAGDEAVWDFAGRNEFAIVSKDSDFHQRSFLLGFPPKVIWVRVGNRSTEDIIRILKRNASAIRDFCADASHTFLALS